MTAIKISGAGQPSQLTRVNFGVGDFNESWIQKHVFDFPNLIPLERIEPGAGSIIPLMREFALPRSGGSVFLDFLGVTRSGRLVLIECKLWRNPQARREVVAQLIEYAALLKGWTFSDLTARLRSALGSSEPNPIYARVRHQLSGLDEATFVDAVARSLQIGDFHLIIVGDGIRSDLHAIGSYINATLGAAARLSLVELQVWKGENDELLVIPQLPLRTEVIVQRIVVDAEGLPLQLAQESASEQSGDFPQAQERAGQRAANRKFWQNVIDKMHFDHPDQPPPRHGGNNWIRLYLPENRFFTAYRWREGLGFTLALSGDQGALIYETLVSDADAIRAESGLNLSFNVDKEEPFAAGVRVQIPDTSMVEEEQKQWFIKVANKLVNCFRPRLARLANENTSQ